MLHAQVDLWWTRLEEPEPPALAERCRRLLTPDELEGETRFRDERLRQRWRSTRALVRSVLSAYGHVAPERWQIRRTSLGKPELIGPAESIPRSEAGPLRWDAGQGGHLQAAGLGTAVLPNDADVLTTASGAPLSRPPAATAPNGLLSPVEAKLLRRIDADVLEADMPA